MSDDPPENPAPRHFRHDINGLRAIAVAIVVLFHFHTYGFWGGFVGVDVFFVISGFLMTQIIWRRLEAGRFSLLEFYGDRVRRIVPALLVLCIVLLLVGGIFLAPHRWQAMARSVISSVLFLSNIDYALQGGYFAGAAEYNWLLHTWSLSVEWQFYLLYPVLLLITRRLRLKRQGVLAVLIALATASLALSVAIAMWHSDGLLRLSFYGLPTRAWEMAAGGIVALAADRERSLPTLVSRLMLVAGLMFIAASVYLYSSSTVWPAGYAVLPVAGAAFVIAAGRGSSAWAQLAPIRFAGLWSYSIYLWHWPIVAAFYLNRLEPSLALAAAGALGATVLGAASYYLVERRLTKTLFSRRKLGLVGVGVCATLLLVGGAVIFLADGFERARTPTAMAAQLKALKSADEDWVYPEICTQSKTTKSGLVLCQMGGAGEVRTLVIGDSYAQQLTPSLVDLPTGPADPAVLFATKSGCAPLPGVQLAGSVSNCAASTAEALGMAASGRYPRVVVAASWVSAFAPQPGAKSRGRLCYRSGMIGCRSSGDQVVYDRDARAAFDDLTAVLKLAKAKGSQILLFRSFPGGDGLDPGDLADMVFAGKTLTNLSISRAKITADSQYADALILAAAAQIGADVESPIARLCGHEQCPALIGHSPIYYDGRHLAASALKQPMFGFVRRDLAPWADDTGPSQP